MSLKALGQKQKLVFILTIETRTPGQGRRTGKRGKGGAKTKKTINMPDKQTHGGD